MTLTFKRRLGEPWRGAVVLLIEGSAVLLLLLMLMLTLRRVGQRCWAVTSWLPDRRSDLMSRIGRPVGSIWSCVHVIYAITHCFTPRGKVVVCLLFLIHVSRGVPLLRWFGPLLTAAQSSSHVRCTSRPSAGLVGLGGCWFIHRHCHVSHTLPDDLPDGAQEGVPEFTRASDGKEKTNISLLHKKYIYIPILNQQCYNTSNIMVYSRQLCIHEHGSWKHIFQLGNQSNVGSSVFSFQLSLILILSVPKGWNIKCTLHSRQSRIELKTCSVMD